MSALDSVHSVDKPEGIRAGAAAISASPELSVVMMLRSGMQVRCPNAVPVPRCVKPNASKQTTKGDASLQHLFVANMPACKPGSEGVHIVS